MKPACLGVPDVPAPYTPICTSTVKQLDLRLSAELKVYASREQQ